MKPRPSGSDAGAQAIAAGGPAPLGATVAAGGVNFSVFAKRADARRAAAVRPRRCDGAGAGDSARRGAPSHLPLLARVRARARGRVSSMPIARTGRSRPSRAAVRRRQGAARSVRPRRRRARGLLARRRQPAGRQQRHGDEERRGRSQRATTGKATRRFDGRSPKPSSTRCTSRGFTRHPSSGVAPAKRGTYAGLIEKIPYLQDLGVTAVELLPVFQFDPLARAGRRRTTGATSRSPSSRRITRYSSRPDPLAVLDEFRDMVKALHRAGIEVILDVVYNHTAEGRPDGPTLCYRGLDNDTYYILEKDRSRYADFTGCGNTLNANQPIVRRLILDSLRYWVTEMHVDGFRFDLASILSRDENGQPLPSPPILWDIESDPLLAGTKLIAEAWDAAGLYQVGSFVGDAWQEWNGRFRDDVRSFVRGDNGTVCAPGDRARRQPRRLRPRGARGRAEHQLRHLPRRLHAERPRLLQREAQRGQRRGQSRRRERQPELELRRRRADRRPGDRGAAQPPDQELPRDHSAVRRHADAADGRRGAAHAAGQQQRLLPGQRDQLVRLGPARASRRHPSLRPAPQRATASAATRRSGSATEQPHAAPRTGQDPVERRRSRPSRLERPLAHAGDHAGEPARPLPAARDLQRVLGAARLRAAAGADELSRLAALHRHGAGVARRHLPRRRRARGHRRALRGAAAVGRRARDGVRPRRDADRGRGEPRHRRRAQPRLHDRAARRVPRRVADDGRPVREPTTNASCIRRPCTICGISRRSAASARRWSTPARGSACSSTRRGWPAASSRAAGSVRA